MSVHLSNVYEALAWAQAEQMVAERTRRCEKPKALDAVVHSVFHMQTVVAGRALDHRSPVKNAQTALPTRGSILPNHLSSLFLRLPQIQKRRMDWQFCIFWVRCNCVLHCGNWKSVGEHDGETMKNRITWCFAFGSWFCPLRKKELIIVVSFNCFFTLGFSI